MVQKYIQPYCLAKYVKLYIGVCCDFEYGTSVPSCGLLFYEQFSTVLKPIMTLVAEISARWRCQHTFPDSDRTTFSRFLTALFLQYYLLSKPPNLLSDPLLYLKLSHNSLVLLKPLKNAKCPKNARTTKKWPKKGKK